MEIGRRIEAARRDRKLSQQQLADKIGKQQTTVSSWERGRTEPSRDDVQRVADALLMTPAELELANGAEQVRRQVKLVGYVGAGAQAHYYTGADDPNEMVEAPDGASATTVAAVVKGTSLGPAFDRWLVYYDDIHSPVSPQLHGQLCVVATSDQVLVKILRPAGEPNRYHLLSNGGEEPLFDREVHWAARVTHMKPR